ncbi:MAG: hypothetical protein K0R84_1677 [Clostridia bacterium]|jgi:hypothetical protein|nr:hypothetical protein [Clostridia bacterium]
MNYRITTKIACRLMALYFFILSINYLPSFIINLIYYSKSMDNVGFTIIISLSYMLPLLIMSILLWIYSEKAAALITKESVEGQAVQSVNISNIAIIAFTVIGLYVLINSISDLARIITSYFAYTREMGVNIENYLYKDFIPNLIKELIRLVLGTWLTFGSKGISKAIKAVRELGTQTIEEPKQ